MDEARPAGRQRGRGDVLLDRPVGEEHQFLMDDGDAGPPRLDHLAERHGAAVDGKLAGVGDHRPRQHADQRRLAGAVGADEAVDLTGANVEGDVIQRADAAEVSC